MYEKELTLAIRAAKAAGQHLMEHYAPRVDSSIGKDIKLNADRESEQILVSLLAETGYPMLSEERGTIAGRAAGEDAAGGLRWIIDPLDGTAHYWRGLTDLACVSVALWQGDAPVLGVVYRFVKGELYHGIIGQGAYLNDTPIHVTQMTKLSDAFLATGFPVKRDYSDKSLTQFLHQIQRFKKIRMLGTAATMGVLVASGKLDAYTEEQIMLWDIAASTAIAKAAGATTEVKMLADHQCICRLFATKELYDAYMQLEEGEIS